MPHPTLTRDLSLPLIEQVREIAAAEAEDGEPLDFFGCAKRLGAAADEAEEIASRLDLRILRSRGAL